MNRPVLDVFKISQNSQETTCARASFTDMSTLLIPAGSSRFESFDLRLVIYPVSGNNATPKTDFTDPWKRSFVRSFLYTGSEMIHLPWINVRRVNLNKKFSGGSHLGFLKFLRNSQENTCVGFSFKQSCRWLGACNFIKKRLQRRCFSVSLQNF